MDEKRIIEGYEVIHAVQLAGGEVILAENKNAAEPYMVCDCSWDNLLGVDVFENGIVSNDFLEVMKEFTQRLTARVEMIEAQRSNRGIPLETLTDVDCNPTSTQDLINQVVVIKPEKLMPEYRSIDHQLALCTGGHGASSEARGRAVFCKNLYSDKSSRWNRTDIMGTVTPDKLPDWAKKKLAALQKPNEKEEVTPKPLDKEQFWQMIAEAWKASGEIWQDMNIPLVESLAKLEETDIIRFKLIFDEYKNLAYKEKLWAAAAIMHGGCSDDGFIDFRAWLIAQGKEAYMDALREPDSLANLATVKEFAIESNSTKFTPPEGYFHSANFDSFNYIANDSYKINIGADSDIYDVIDGNSLSKQEKADIAREISYAEDIDVKWGGFSKSREEINAMLEKMLPTLHKVFHGVPEAVITQKPSEKESVIEKIRQSKQQKEPKKAQNTERKKRVESRE